MKRDTERQEGAPLIGGSSLLVIFAVLCLTVFALLGLSTAQAGQRLSKASAAVTTGYYQADAQAERILAQLRSGEMPENVTAQAGNRYTYACPVSDTQELQVEVQVSGKNYHILRWQTVSTTDWQAGDDMTVWDGETQTGEGQP